MGFELVSPNKNHDIPENASYFKPRTTVSTYLQLTANFTGKIVLHKVYTSFYEKACLLQVLINSFMRETVII